jgi:hypothetical protein
MHTTVTAIVSRYLVVTTTSTGAAYALGRIAIDSFAVRGPYGRVATALNANLSNQPTNETRR